MSQPPVTPPLRGAALAIATVAIATASFMNILDTTIAVVAVPTIAGSLAATASQGSWIITSYAVSLAVVLPLSGWVTRRYGQVQTFVVSVCLFTLMSWLCGLATTFNQLLLFRALQGLSGGLLLPLSQSLLMRIYPIERHGTALGIWSLTSAVAPVVGPLLGGYLTETVGWPWIFYINVPFGLLAAYLCWTLVRPFESERVREPVDGVGLALLVIGLLCVQMVLDRGHELDWLAAVEIRTLLALGLACLVLFFAWERDAPYPIVDLTLFRHANFAAGTTLFAVFYGTFILSTVIYPIWMQTVLGYTAQWAGIVMAATSVVPLLAMPLIGHYLHDIDPRPVITAGVAVLGIALLLHAQSYTQVPATYLAFSRLMIGLAMPFIVMPLMMLSLIGLPPEKLSTAAGLFNCMRMLAASMGTALGITLWDERTVLHRERLVEAVSRDSVERTQLLDALGDGFAGAQSALAALEQMLMSQARTLAHQDLFLLCTVLMVPIGLSCWLLPARSRGRQADRAAVGAVHD